MFQTLFQNYETSSSASVLHFNTPVFRNAGEFRYRFRSRSSTRLLRKVSDILLSSKNGSSKTLSHFQQESYAINRGLATRLECIGVMPYNLLSVTWQHK